MAIASEHHHRDISGGAARAAVFGVSDGLVSNVSLILGMAGARPDASVVRLAGLAGLIAGACSMAVGEYLSVSAQKELAERELRIERYEIVNNASKEEAELVERYRARGVSKSAAEEVAGVIMSDTDQALEVHAREELGVDPENLGSPIQAAVASFVAFTLGAFLPLIPWLRLSTGNTTAVVASLLLAVLGAIVVGTVLATFTGRPRWRIALRQVTFAAASAAIAYGVGSLVGVSTS